MVPYPQYEYSVHTLSNGIRLVHRYTPSQVAHMGVTIDVGSRDEKAGENGIAHFIEHCIFKGTEKRRSSQILSRIDGVGGELNAYTTKEETVVYCTFTDNYYERAAQLLSDIVFHSVFPEKELQKEKTVILDEINSYEDSPAELIYDSFESLVFGRTALGRNILGTPENVRKFTGDDVRSFIQRTWSTDLIAVSTVGNIDFDRWVRLCEKYFSDAPLTASSSRRRSHYTYRPKHITENRDTYQAHLMIGCPAYSYRDSRKVAFSLLNNVLGSNAMNSVLNMKIREKYGFTYVLESSYTAYCDNGIFQIYAGTDDAYADRTRQLIMHELERFASTRMTQSYLTRAKQQLKGQIAIQYDSNQNEMLSIGKTLLNYSKVESLSKTYEEIDAVTSDDVLTVAGEIFIPDNMSTLLYL